MMSPAEITSWWGTIYLHYGTLSKFNDATTIRHIRQSCLRWAGEDVAMLMTLEPFPEEHADWDRSFISERALISFTLGSCTMWLKQRGLPL